MQRLLEDAEKISGIEYDISSYADIVDAIHVVQTEMGITGTTAKEAGTTIQGAVSSMKSAWTNLLTGLSDGNANIEQLVDNLVTTIVGDGTETNLGVLGNILPAVQTALNGASTLISAALPKIMEIIPAIINDNLPVLAEAAVSIIQSLIDGISQNQEMLFTTILGVVTYLAESFITMLPQIVQLGLDLIVSLANGISESLPELIPTIVDVVLQIVETLIDNVDMLVDASIEIIVALAEGLINALPTLIEKAPEIIAAIVVGLVDNMDVIIEAGAELLEWIWEGLKSGFSDLWEKAKEIGKEVVDGIKQGISDTWDDIKNWFNNLWDSLFGDLSVDVSADTSGASNYNRPTAPVSTPSRKSGGYGVGGTVINQYIQGTKQSPSEIAGATKAMFTGARYALR